MNVNRILCVREEDTVTTLRGFLSAWWEHLGLDAMLAPVESTEQHGVTSQVIDSPVGLTAVNPFAPVMLSNAAAAVEEFIRDHPSRRLAIMLRPCELRTLVELNKRRRVFAYAPGSDGSDDNLVIIGVDCPGTYPAAEFIERVDEHGIDAVTRELLIYGVEDSSMLKQLRTACQVCDRPAPSNADITIGAIGVDPQQFLLVIARDEATYVRLGLHEVTDRLATEEQVVRREMMVDAIADKRVARRISMTDSDTRRFGDFCSLLACFARCTLCADCLDACPLYEGELTGMLGVGSTYEHGRPLLPELVGVVRWLASCSGCGMCQEACEYGVPLAELISSLSHRIHDEIHYTAGDPTQRLPWGVGQPRPRHAPS